ncbi:MAG: Imm50 family immunity protein [Chitinophagales bacterium]
MWTQFLLNNKGIHTIFSKIPSLNEVEIFALNFDRNCSSLNMVVELKDYPIHPPKKWVASKYNTVQLVFSLIDISHIELSSWNTENYVSIKIEKSNDRLLLETLGNIKLKVGFGFLDLKKISAYQKNPLLKSKKI